jgi:hypothetical protein
MRRLVFFAAVVAGLTLAATAGAKGPIAGTIDGPGTGGGISLGGDGEPGSGGPLGTFAQEAGFFPALFVQTPDPMLDARPKGDLGPRYTVTYRLPGPNGTEETIRQDLYPYAPAGPVTYTEPGQRFFETRTSHGGWYQASPHLKTLLVGAGLPSSAPSGGSSDDGFGFNDVWLPVAIAILLALAALSAVIVRRRPRAAAAS